MPKTPMDYSKCCIYKIEHFENESLVYVGHTTNFTKRKGEHKSNSKNENNKKFNFKLYQMIRDNGGFDRFKMIEVEKYPCKDKREALRREDEIMKELKASMNTIKSFLTEEERKKYNKEYNKEYNENNKEYIKERKNEYMKQYCEDNKERKNEYMKQYCEDNKEYIKEKKREKITCKCGSVVTKVHLKRHERNKKHINLMNQIE
jgi:hypothetical protein